MRKQAASLACFAVVLAVSGWVLFTPFCGLLYRCGCSFPWAGGEARCNISNASGPHCPWCEHPALAVGVAAAIAAGEAGAFLALRKRGRSRALATIVALATFPAVGLV